jgi:hypothetical protein
MWTTNRNIFEARRFVGRAATTSERDVVEDLEHIFAPKQQQEFDPKLMARLQSTFPGSPGEDYMLSRGFERETLLHFGIGWSGKRRSVTTPIHSFDGVVVGFQARNIDQKRFSFSSGIPMHETLFNLHDAKRHSDRVVIVEAPYDAMRIWQAGFPNVVAVCGGNLTKHQSALLNRHFNSIIIMADNDPRPIYSKRRCSKCGGECQGHYPGIEFGEGISKSLPTKSIYWSQPIEGKKDACDMTDDEIRHALTNLELDLERQLAVVD